MKNLMNLGKALNKKEQQTINGGGKGICGGGYINPNPEEITCLPGYHPHLNNSICCFD